MIFLVVKTPMTPATWLPLDQVYCINCYGNDSAFDTLELLQNSVDKSNSKVAWVQVNIAGFSLHSSLALDRYINDFDIVAMSDSHGQLLGFKNYDVYFSRVQTHENVLIVNDHVKSYEVEEQIL